MWRASRQVFTFHTPASVNTGLHRQILDQDSYFCIHHTIGTPPLWQTLHQQAAELYYCTSLHNRIKQMPFAPHPVWACKRINPTDPMAQTTDKWFFFTPPPLPSTILSLLFAETAGYVWEASSNPCDSFIVSILLDLKTVSSHNIFGTL